MLRDNAIFMFVLDMDLNRFSMKVLSDSVVFLVAVKYCEVAILVGRSCSAFYLLVDL